MSNMLRFNQIVLVALAVSLVFVSAAQAQGPSGDRVTDQTREQLREHLRERIDATPGLTTDERSAMHTNLQVCFDLGVSEAGLEAVFPGEDHRHNLSAQAMIQLQNRVVSVAGEGMFADPILVKVQEGRTKGVPEPMLEQVCARMEEHVRAAHHVMEQAMNDGVQPAPDRTHERQMHMDMAQQMWRGMGDADFDQLREHARLRSDRCRMDDFLSSGEVATRLLEAGVGHERAMRLSGEALQNGYGAHEMRQIQIMMASQKHKSGAFDHFLGDLERCVDAGMGPGEMYNYMMRHGWMGPGDMHGPGGYHPMDHKGYGGGHHEGEDGGHGDDGGSHGGGGHGGKDGEM